MKSGELVRGWNERGYVVVPGLFGPALVGRLRRICDRVLAQWVAESPKPSEAANSTNMAYLTEPRYFPARRGELTALLEAVADERVLDTLRLLLGAEPLFHNTQYFFDPADETRDGDWHRDQQFGAPDDETEKSRMREHAGVHLHVAFLPDDNLEYVPGSHARWDTAAELAIRRGASGAKRNSPEMSGAERIALGSGDGVFFSAWGIHRGRYVAGRPRRTFDAIYGTASPHPAWFTPPPTCFLSEGALDGLSEGARAFYERFADHYRRRWLSGEYDT